MMKALHRFTMPVLGVMLLVLIKSASAAPASAFAAQVVSARAGAWVYTQGVSRPAREGEAVQPGDRLRTDSFGRMSLLLPDHTLLKIDRDVSFIY